MTQGHQIQFVIELESKEVPRQDPGEQERNSLSKPKID